MDPDHRRGRRRVGKGNKKGKRREGERGGGRGGPKMGCRERERERDSFKRNGEGQKKQWFGFTREVTEEHGCQISVSFYIYISNTISSSISTQ